MSEKNKNGEFDLKLDKENHKVGEDMVEFDDLLEFVGSNGRYQKYVLYGALMPLSFIMALMSFTGIFTMFIPEHFCSPPELLEGSTLEEWKIKNIPKESGLDATEKFSSCTMYNFTFTEDYNTTETMSCQNGWTFSKQDFERTIATDNLWICEKDFYPTKVFTIGGSGFFVGSIVFGPLADKFGRKSMLLFCLVLYLMSISISYFVTHIYWLYLTCTFISASGFTMVYTLPPLLMAEFCDNGYRAWTYTMGWVAWVFGMATIPLIAYLSRTWYVLSMCVTLPGFLILVIFPFLPESPRWLVTMGRVNDAAKIMRQVTKVNGTQHKITDAELVAVIQKLVDLEKEKDRKVMGFWTLFTTKRLTMITCLISVLCAISIMIYDIITLNTPYMGGNQFLNFFILAIVELPASVVAGFMIGSLGRRWTPVLFSIFMAIVSFVAGAGPQNNESLIITCIMLSKFAVTITTYVVYVQATELFPTPLRATGSAVSSAITSTLNLLTPYVAYTAKIYSGAPYLVMSLIAFIGAILAAFLPETLRQHLPETIEDADDFGRGNKFWSIHPDYDRKRRKSIRRASLCPVQTASAAASQPSPHSQHTTNV